LLLAPNTTSAEWLDGVIAGGRFARTEKGEAG
jgi:hypothetical protein